METQNLEYLVNAIKEAKELPRYSHESLLLNVLHSLSMDSSCYEEETGDCSEWVRHAVLFRFEKQEAEFLAGQFEEFDAVADVSIGFSIDDAGNPSIINESEFRSIDRAYEEFLAEQEDICEECECSEDDCLCEEEDEEEEEETD